MSRSLGQSAVEYLATYGWMLVAVSVAGGTVYSFVGVGCSASSSGFYSDSIDVENFGVNDNGTFLISVKNGEESQVEITGLNLTSENSQRFRNTSTSINSGNTSAVGLPGYQATENCHEYDVAMRYAKSGLEDQKITGSIRAPIGTGPLPIPDVPDNLTVRI